MKSMKKLVLAGLVLLASVVVLAGCDTPLEPESTTANEQAGGSENDSVPEVPKYTVKFETEHGTVPASITVESGTKLTAEQLQALPDTEDNIFEGWYDGETQAKGGEYTVTKDVTLVAKWRNRDTVDSVTFDPSSTKLYYGDTVTVTLSTTTEGARIHYQLGEEEWEIYEKPFTVSSETVVTAYATKDGLKDSEKTKSNYLRQLLSITVIPPTRTVYSVGEPFDSTGMIVTATYEDGNTREATGWTTDFDVVTSEKGVNKTVAVSYTEGDNAVTATFTVDVVDPSVPTILTSYISPNHTDDTCTYVAFGEWPQTKADVEVSSLELVDSGRGYFKDNYYTDGKGNYYVEVTAAPCEDGYKYGDGSSVEKNAEVYFKVEPIVWRVLTEDYKVPGEGGEQQKNALLLAENILTGGIKWADSKNNYQESNIRKWLNGNSSDAGFLQTAFTENAQKKEIIVDTEVDNSARSTNPDSNDKAFNSGVNQYASETKTKDKIFLLSEQEATKEAYGFGVYDACGQGNTRIRVTTDYAKATGAYQSGTAGYGGWWWLRSPICNGEYHARHIDNDGYANDLISVGNLRVGVVPALSISLEGN